MFDYVHIIEAIQVVFAPDVMLWVLAGVIVGVGVGALPGMSPAPAIALLLPLTLTLSLPASLGLLIGVFKGGIYGGSISAISFATPGTAEAGATVYDGYKLMQQGKGKKALDISLNASVTGDLLSSILTIFTAPALALIALKFGPSERLWLYVFSIALLGALSGDHLAKGLFSAALGLFLATIGSDPVSMVPRNTFGQWWLADGVQLIPLIVGLFAVATMLEKLVELAGNWSEPRELYQRVMKRLGGKKESLTFREYLSCWKEMAIGTGIGSFIGFMPGVGATVGAFLSYGVARQMSPSKDIGSGRIEGIAAAESGNNATAAPGLIPLLAFGIPGGTVAAMLGGALAIQGVVAGPRMFELYPTEVYALFVILLVSNVLLYVVGRLFAGFYAKLGQVPAQLLIPVILAMAIVGAYAYRSNPFDVGLVLLFGFVGYLMRLTKIPEAPLIVAFLLAPLAEASFRRALLISGGDWMEALFDSNLAIGLAAATLILVFVLARAEVSRRAKTMAS